ncbi:tetratricopeptide repeat protein [Streptomyces sp. NPDC003470]
MSRLGRDEQRAQLRAERPLASVETPIDVRVPEAGGDARGASVDGVLVVAAPGEEIRHAVLNRLHRFALAGGRSVLATIHDERIGCVVRLRVDPDGSSHLAGKPVPTPRTPVAPEAVAVAPAVPASEPASAGPAVRQAPAVPTGEVPAGAPAPAAPVADGPAAAEPQRTASRASVPTFVPRALPEPAVPTAPGTVAPPTGVFGPPPRMDAAPAAGGTAADPAAPAGPASAAHRAGPYAPGAPTPPSAPGPYAPAPVAPAGPAPADRASAAPAPTGSASSGSASSGPTSTDPASWGTAPTGPAPSGPAFPAPVAGAARGVPHAPAPVPGPVSAARPKPVPGLVLDADPGPRSTPTPARGFDAVAEAVLGDAPLTAPGDATTPALLAEPTARINEAVKEGRTQDAARLAERSVSDASDTLGPEHPEVLRLRELTAYIAYLSGDPERAFRLSLDLARIHRTAGDAEAAYGNVQSAATAWRAVRDPERGLELGHDLVGLWSELAAGPGPAADDVEELETARTRMGRLADRARAHARAD